MAIVISRIKLWYSLLIFRRPGAMQERFRGSRSESVSAKRTLSYLIFTCFMHLCSGIRRTLAPSCYSMCAAKFSSASGVLTATSFVSRESLMPDEASSQVLLASLSRYRL